MEEYNEELKQIIWEKGIVEPGFDPNLARKDACGAWMLRNQYANIDSDFGWEIDHVYPRALGGTTIEENLRPMQWKNNRSKGDDYPSYTACMRAVNNENEQVDEQYTVNESLQKKLAQIYNIQ